MLDLPSETSEAWPATAKASAHGQRLWAVLLVLDSFFVIIFGGALAARIYQYLEAPAAPLPRPAPRPILPRVDPAKLAVTPTTISVPTASQAAAPPKPAAKLPPVTLKSGEIRPPKPSLLHEAPRHEAASPQTAGGAPAAAAPQPAAQPGLEPKVKAQPVEFHYRGAGRKVEIAGAFIVHGGRKPMIQREGAWSITLYLTPNTYRYWFIVDGRRRLDPDNSSQDRNASVVVVSPKGQ